VPDDLAVDGVDETLNRFLAFGSAGWPEVLAQLKGEHLAGEDGLDTITVAAGGRAWTIWPSPREVVVEDGGRDDSRVSIEGPPARVLRWLWGRAGHDAVRLTGDPAWADYLRRMLAAVTR